MKGKYLQMKTKAVFTHQDSNLSGEVHEDLGFFSYDQARKKIILRQLHIEGYVNTYILEKIPQIGEAFVFVSEHLENAPPSMKAKEVFKLTDENTMEQSFYLSMSEDNFQCYSVNTMLRRH